MFLPSFLIRIVVDKATESYIKMSQCEADEGLAAGYFVEAAMSMKKVNTSEAVKLMERAVECYCSTGGIHMAAKYCKQIAEWYEDDFEYELAIKYYLKAADLEGMETADTFGYQCMLKAADLMVLSKEERFVEAIQVSGEFGNLR